MFKPTAIKIATLGAVLAPSVALAQNFTQVNNILSSTKGVLNTLVPILITLAVIYFIWGVISYVIAKDEEARKESRDKMIYGIIGLFVIIAIWGLVAFLANTLGVGVEGNVNAPCVADANPYIDGCQ